MERADTRDRPPRDTIASVGAGVIINGEVGCETDLQIDGRVNGDVRCATLFLGETGIVDGNVQADRVRISGTVEGSVIAGDLAIEATARVRGDVVYARLKVTAGGMIEGSLKHRAAEGGAAEPASLKLVEQPDPAPQSRRVYID